jgi:hypothetical protein
MHYVSYVKAENPIIAAVSLDAEGRPRRDLILLLTLQIVDLLKRLERNLQPLFFCKVIPKMRMPLTRTQLTNIKELSLNVEKLFHNLMALLKLPLENFYLLRHVVAARPVAVSRAAPRGLADSSLPTLHLDDLLFVSFL